MKLNSKENGLIPTKLDNTYKIIQCMNGIREGVTASNGIETQNWNHSVANRLVYKLYFHFSILVSIVNGEYTSS